SALGGGQEANAIRAILVTDFAQPLRREVQSLVPTALSQLNLPQPDPAQQWLRQAVWCVYKVIAKTPFDAEIATVDVIIKAAVTAVDEAVLHMKVDLASNAAVGAG